MKYEITLPILSDTMSTGRLTRWLKQPGDKINKGDVIAEMESDKAVMEVEAFHSGFLAGPLAPLNTDIPVRQVIAYIVDELEGGKENVQTHQQEVNDLEPTLENRMDSAPETKVSTPVHDHDATDDQTASSQEKVTNSDFVLPVRGKRIASPHARALALKLGLELSQVSPGSDGRILAEDVLAASQHVPSLNLEAGPPYHIKPLTLMQKAVANHMIGTLTTPTFRTTAQISLGELKKKAKQSRISLTLMLATACAKAIEASPRFNAVYTPEGMAYRERIDIGIAVDVPGGLLTPVLRDVSGRPLDELAEDWRKLKEKIKRQRLTQQEYEGATFYLSNLGVFSVVHSFDALVPLGAAAILAIGSEQDGHCFFTLSCDHRVVSGADSARFLENLQGFLQSPEELMSGYSI